MILLPKVRSRTVRYVFIDVVNFTQGRSIEAQTSIVAALNSITKLAMRRCKISIDQTIMLPTGDGLGIAILDEALPVDIHLKLALALLSEVSRRNATIADSPRRFEIRVGINQNTDNLVFDINGNVNVAGAGVNLAQRIMDYGSAQNIMVGSMVYEVLSQREKYMNSFKRRSAPIKHGNFIPIYQFIEDGHKGLSCSHSSETKKEYQVREIDAFYLAFSLKLRDFITSHMGGGKHGYSLVVMLWYLSLDAKTRMNAKPFDSLMWRLYDDYDSSLQQVFDYYQSIDFWLICDFSSSISKELTGLSSLFEDGNLLFINDQGKAKLESDFTEILEYVNNFELTLDRRLDNYNI